MLTKFGRTVRTTAVALVLAAGAGVVLGTAPASADSATIDFELASRSPQKPAWDPSVRATEGAASRSDTTSNPAVPPRGIAPAHHGGTMPTP